MHQLRSRPRRGFKNRRHSKTCSARATVILRVIRQVVRQVVGQQSIGRVKAETNLKNLKECAGRPAGGDHCARARTRL